MTLLVFFTILLLSFWSGYRKGLIKVAFNLAGLIIGYMMAWFQTQTLNQILISMGFHQSFLLFGGSALLIFFFFYYSFMIAGLVVHRTVVHGRKRQQVSKSYWVSGALMNGIPGCFYALALVWCLGQLRSPQVPGTTSNTIDHLSTAMIQGLTRGAADRYFPENDPMADVLSKLIANPQKSALSLKELSDNPDFQLFFRDPDIRQALEESRVSDLIQSPPFKKMSENPQIRDQFENLGLGDSDEQLGQNLISLWGKANSLGQNPQARAILNDPDFQKLIQDHNIMALLGDPRFLELSKILSSTNENAKQGETPPAMNEENQNQADRGPKPEEENHENVTVKKDKKLYSWHDENGKLFISDQPPPKTTNNKEPENEHQQ